MMTMTLEQATHAMEGELVAPSAQPQTITTVVTDSRQVEAGSLFVAIAGEHVDGHEYLAQAQSAGAVAAVVDHVVDGVSLTQIVVADTVAALGALAAYNIQRRREQATPFSVIGITGSVGKTTTKDILATLLRELGPTVAPVGSFNNEIGLPLTCCEVNADTRFLVAEMGANHVGEIAHLTTIAPPDLAIVLKVGVAHLGEFGSVERIAQAKSELVRGILGDGVTILNADDTRVAAMRELAPGKVMWFGIDHAQEHDTDSYISADDIAIDDSGRPSFAMVDNDGVEQFVQLALHGEHNVMNALAAACAAQYCGLSLAQIARVLSDIASISPHRMDIRRVQRHQHDYTVIDDSFNANPDSMKAAVNALMQWHAQESTQPTRVAILGAMLELGDNERQAHEEIGAYAVHAGVDTIIAVGSTQDEHLNALAQDIVRGAQNACDADTQCTIVLASSIDEADRNLDTVLDQYDDVTVLCKGSHASGVSALATRFLESAVDHA